MFNKLKFLESKRNQLIISLVILVILLATGLTLLGTKYSNDIRINNYVEKVQGITRVTTHHLAMAATSKDSFSIKTILYPLKELQFYQSSLLFNELDTVIFRDNKIYFNYSYLKKHKFYINKDSNFVQILEPIIYNNVFHGQMIAQYSLGSFNSGIKSTIKYFTIIGIIASILGFIVTFFISKSFISPLNELNVAFSDISNLNLNKRVEIKSNDEYSNLSRSFNNIVDKLEKAYLDLSNMNKSLEDNIAERTLKLKDEIADRKEIQKNLSKTNELITSIINSSPLPILTLNTDGKILSASPSYFDLIKSSPDSLYLDTFPLKDEYEKQKFSKGVNDCIQKMQKNIINVTFFIADNDTIIKIYLSPIIDHNKESTKIIAIIDDITEAIEKDIAIVESEEKYRNLVSNARVGIGIFRDNYKAFANDYLLDLLGIENLEEFNKIDLKDLTPKEYLDNYDDIMDINSVNFNSYDIAIHNLKGDLLYLEVTKSLVFLNDVNYLQLAIIDVTERVKYSNELKEMNVVLEQRVIERTEELNNTLNNLQSEIEIRLLAEEQLRLSDRILQRVAAIVIVVDQNADIIYSNPYIKNILGYTSEEVLNNGWWENMYKDKEFIKNERNNLIEYATKKKPINDTPYERIYSTKNGQQKWIQWQEVLGDNNTVIAVGNDITSQIIAKEKLKEASKELQNSLEKEKELGDLKMRFISMISHEYRTPLTIILSSATIISKLVEREEFSKIDSFLNKIDSSVQSMVKLLEDVLSLGKSQSGEVKTQLYYINLELLLNQTITDVKTSNNYNHKINLDISGDFKEIYTDEKLMRQILNNIITNAFKYSPNEECIYISLNDKKEFFQLIVKDSGIGIPKEELNNLFGSFYRASNVGTISGTGLGMPILKNAVDSLKGKISVESELNIGSVFTVELPYLDTNLL